MYQSPVTFRWDALSNIIDPPDPQAYRVEVYFVDPELAPEFQHQLIVDLQYLDTTEVTLDLPVCLGNQRLEFAVFAYAGPQGNRIMVGRLMNVYTSGYGWDYRFQVEAGTGTPIISTIAGTGTAGDTGDGGAATNAQLDYPHGMVMDSAGNIFIADTGNHRIRRIDAGTGNISTFAGTGIAGWLDDQRLLAQFDSPRGLAFDSQGNLFVADYGNDRIRRIDASSGLVSTIAGQSTHGESGDGGPAINAYLSSPSALVIDSSDNIYIADEENYKVRRIDKADSNIYLVAGDESSAFDPAAYVDGVTGGDEGDLPCKPLCTILPVLRWTDKGIFI